MSTWYSYRVRCPGCNTEGEIQLLKGIHVGRMPDIKRVICEGKFQVFQCAQCGMETQMEAPGIYTDFPSGHYIGVELPGEPKAARARHREIFDGCFTLGPDIVHELGAALVHRIVFSTAALREKVLIWEAGLDDRVVEALKADAQAEQDIKAEVWRLVATLPAKDSPGARHLVFVRLPPPPTERLPHPLPDQAPIAPGLPEPAGGILPFTRNRQPMIGHLTLPAVRYLQKQRQGRSAFAKLPWLLDDWIVDLWDGRGLGT